MGKWGRWAWNAVNALFILIGIGGIPSAFIQWGSWLQALDQNRARWLFLIAGVIGLLIVNRSRAPRADSRSAIRNRALALSGEILRFLTERLGSEPSPPHPGTWERDTDSMMRYSGQTMRLFSEKFGAKIIAMRNALAQKGLTDKELDSHYEHPTNPIGIRIVGERLGALAHQMALEDSSESD